jgi:two-component system, LytTR family, response regulator
MSKLERKPGFNVLIVDDEYDARFLIATLLDAVCPEAMHKFAADAQQAFNAIEQNHFDLILSDIEMPQYNGLQFVAGLRDKGIDTPVVFITAYDKFTYAQQAIRLGAVDFLLKPLSEKQLRDVIDRLRSIPGRPERESAEITQAQKLISVRSVNTIIVYKLKDILYFEADGAYSTLYSIDGKKDLVLEGLIEIESRLDPSVFIRTDRKHLINISHLRKIDLKNHSITLDDNNNEIILNITQNGCQMLKRRIDGSLEL